MRIYSLEDQVPFGIMKGKTLRQVIDEHYWYFKNILTWNNFKLGKDVISYHKEIKTKIYNLHRGLK